MAETVAQLFTSTNFSETAAMHTATLLEAEGSPLSLAIARDLRTDLASARAQRDKYIARAHARGETTSKPNPLAAIPPASKQFAAAAPQGKGATGSNSGGGIEGTCGNANA